MDTYKMILKINLLIFIFLSGNICHSQTGPGGVGKTDGTSSLRIWLQGEKGVETTGGEVNVWNDQSGWNNDAVAGASQRPELMTNSLNGLPGLQFVNDKLTVTANASIQTISNNIFVVVKRTSATNFGTILARRYYPDGQWQSPYVTYSMQANNNSSGTPYVQATINGPVALSNYDSPHNEISNSQPYLHQIVYDGNHLESWINNTNPKFAEGAGQLNYNSNNNPLMLGYGGGSSVSYPDDYFNGLIYEVICFGENINVCKQVVILNYLASKYGLSVAYDKYAEVPGFTCDIIGIGAEGPDTHTESTGGGITLLANSGYPTNTWNSYIFAAHNNGVLKGTTTNVPAGYNNRFQRIWNLKKTGTLPVNLTIRFTLPRNPGNDKNKYGLLWSANEDFSNPVEVAPANSVVVGTKTVSFYFSDPSVLPDGFYTLGNKLNQWNGSVGPLWETSGNWDGNLPDLEDNILIAGGCLNYPVLAQNVQLGSLSIEQDGYLSTWNYNLTVAGYCNISGGFNSGTGKVIITGNSNSDVYCGNYSFHHFEISKSSGKTVTIWDNYHVTGNLTLLSGTINTENNSGEVGGNLVVSSGQTIWGRNLIFNGSSSQTISLASNALVSLSELIINNTSTSQVVDASQVAITGELRVPIITLNDGYLKWGHDNVNQLVIASGTAFELSENVNVTKSWTNNGGQFLPGGFQVNFTSGGSYNLKSSGQPFGNLTINKSTGTLTLMDNLMVNGNFDLQSGTFNAGSNEISVSGNLNFIGTFNCGTSVIVLEGANQEVTGNSTVFHNLETHEPAIVTLNGTSGNLYQVSGNLTLRNGSTFIVGSDQILTVDGTVLNESDSQGLIIKSDAVSTGIFIHNTAGVNATSERYIAESLWTDPEDGWHFLASPVNGFLLDGSDFINLPISSYDLFSWSENQNLWLNQKLPENNITHFNKGQGYLVSYDNEDVKEFTGALEVSDAIVSGLVKSGENRGWHLLGNPFSAPVEWNNGNWSLVNISGVAKIWDEAGKSYVDISAGEVIPQMQGFMVQVTESPGSLVIPASSRVGRQLAWYKSDRTGKIVLTVSEANGRSSQKCSIISNTEATNGFDPGFDSHFLPGYAPQFYSLSGNEKLSTNSIPEISNGQTVELIFIKNQATDYRIKLTETIENQVLLLTDKKNGFTYNLTENPTYEFTSLAEDNPNRFLLGFQTLGAPEPDIQDSGFAFCDGRQIFIQTDESESHLWIYNLNGQIVFNQVFNSQGLHTPDFKAKTGVYLLVLENIKGIRTSKIFKLTF